LSPAEYDVVEALIDVGRSPGLTLNELRKETGRKDPRTTLWRLKKSSPGWGRVIYLAGHRFGRYRIDWPEEDHESTSLSHYDLVLELHLLLRESDEDTTRMAILIGEMKRRFKRICVLTEIIEEERKRLDSQKGNEQS
jgi:hypothetical protein